jgi:transposase InsO family protein
MRNLGNQRQALRVLLIHSTWTVHETENSDYASELVRAACFTEKVARDQLVIHSDNGSPMKGSTMLATLQEIGVMLSFSRPAVSNDNPFSESLFRTCTYRPDYPEKPFETLEPPGNGSLNSWPGIT